MTAETLDDVIRQLDLFSMADKQVAPPSNGTPTSALAALQAIPHEGSQKMRILQLLADRGERGATMDEAEVQTGILKSACCGRFNRMADDGWITPINETRLTRWKRMAVVYAITPRGLAVLRGESSPPPASPLEKREPSATPTGGRSS